MPNKKYYLDQDKNEMIELGWKAGYREVTVSFNNQLLLTMNREEVSSGKSVELPDGRNVDIKLEGGFFAALTAKINGKHIPGTQGDPAWQLKQVFYLLIALGLLNIIIGMIFALGNIEIDQLPGIGYINVAVGIIYIALGYAVSKGSMMALVIVSVLMIADLAMAAMYSAESGTTAGLIMKVFFVVYIVRGFKFMKEYRATQNSVQNI